MQESLGKLITGFGDMGIGNHARIFQGNGNYRVSHIPFPGATIHIIYKTFSGKDLG